MKSIFKQLMENEDFRRIAILASHKGQHINAGPWELSVPGIPKDGESVEPHLKAIMTSADLPSEQTAAAVFSEGRKVFVADLMLNVGMDTPSLSYARLTDLSLSAGGVAEAAAKPEVGAGIEPVSAKVDTIVAWLPYTRQGLTSAPGVATFIQNVLLYLLAHARDQAVLNSTVNFQGILNVTGVQTQALGADTKTDAIRKAITKIRNAGGVGWEPSALVLNPADAEDLETLKDSSGGYVLIPAVAAPYWEPLQAQYWRVPVIESMAIAAGTGLIGAFDVAAAVFNYGGVDVRISDSHDDFFAKNKVAIIAEVRELVATYVPMAFCKITGI